MKIICVLIQILFTYIQLRIMHKRSADPMPFVFHIALYFVCLFPIIGIASPLAILIINLLEENIKFNLPKTNIDTNFLMDKLYGNRS